MIAFAWTGPVFLLTSANLSRGPWVFLASLALAGLLWLAWTSPIGGFIRGVASGFVHMRSVRTGKPCPSWCGFCNYPDKGFTSQFERLARSVYRMPEPRTGLERAEPYESIDHDDAFRKRIAEIEAKTAAELLEIDRKYAEDMAALNALPTSLPDLPTCETCKHFSFREAARYFDSYPDLKVLRTETSRLWIGRNMAENPLWEDLGACRLKSEIHPKQETCEQHCPGLPEPEPGIGCPPMTIRVRDLSGLDNGPDEQDEQDEQDEPALPEPSRAPLSAEITREAPAIASEPPTGPETGEEP